MTRRILLLISLTAILTTAVLHSQQPVLQPQAVQLAEVRSPEEMDEHITGLYKRKFYDRAQKEAETFLQRYPTHDRAQVISEILIDCLCRQQLNDQAIFLLREDAFSTPGVTPQQVLRQARLVADGYLRKNTVLGRAAHRVPAPVWALFGAVASCLAWSAALFLF